MPSFKNYQGKSACEKVGKRGFTNFNKIRNLHGGVVHGVVSRMDSSDPAVLVDNAKNSVQQPVQVVEPVQVPVPVQVQVQVQQPDNALQQQRIINALLDFRVYESIARNAKNQKKNRLLQLTRDKNAASNYRKYIALGGTPLIDTFFGNNGSYGLPNKYDPTSPHYNAAWN